MRQLAGMRGLMAKPSGEIIETPIISNFKEGLTVLEYFNSTHGARKGLADTALEDGELGLPDAPSRRRGAGLHRQLGRLRHRQRASPCSRSSMPARSSPRSASASSAVPRSTTSTIRSPASCIVKAGTLIDERDVDEIEKAGIQSIRIRSALTCEVKTGVCAVCYGRDLARGTPVNMGEAVGVIAAQSIGEPGTQLTMRTFHMGGTAQVVDQSFLEASYEGTVADPQPQRGAQLRRPADGHGPQHGGADPRRGRQGARHAPRHLRFAHASWTMATR